MRSTIMLRRLNIEPVRRRLPFILSFVLTLIFATCLVTSFGRGPGLDTQVDRIVFQAAMFDGVGRFWWTFGANPGDAYFEWGMGRHEYSSFRDRDIFVNRVAGFSFVRRPGSQYYGESYFFRIPLYAPTALVALVSACLWRHQRRIASGNGFHVEKLGARAQIAVTSCKWPTGLSSPAPSPAASGSSDSP